MQFDLQLSIKVGNAVSDFKRQNFEIDFLFSFLIIVFIEAGRDIGPCLTGRFGCIQCGEPHFESPNAFSQGASHDHQRKKAVHSFADQAG